MYKFISIIKNILITFFVLNILFYSANLYALEKIKLQLKWKHQFQFAGFYAAQKQGFFKDEGFDVNINEVDFSRSTSDIVLSGDAEFGISDSSLVLSRLKGKTVVIIAAIYQHSPLVLLTLKSSNILSPIELRNKRVMYQKNIDDAVLTAMFTELNLKDEDHTHVQHTFQDNALISGNVDAMSAYMTDQPFYFKEKNIDINIISPSSYGIDFYGDMIFVTEDYLKQNKKKVQAFRRASIKGWKYALENQEEMVDWIIANYDTDKTRAHLLYEAEHTARMILPEFIEIGHFSINRLKKIASIYKNIGLAPRDQELTGINYQDYYNEGVNEGKILKIALFILLGFIVSISLFWIIYRRLKKLIYIRTTQFNDSQTKLQSNEALMRGLFELSPVGIALNDFETGEFLRVNNAIVAPTGYTHDEFINLSYWDITPIDYEPQEAEQLKVLNETGRYGPYQKEYIKKNGDRYPVLLYGMVITDQFTNKKMIWSIVEDITERKRSEDELINAKNAALQAAETKSNFLASMSHEIRTPMNGVIGMLDLLKESDLSEDQAYRLKLAQFSAKSLLTLINDILDYSKVDAGKLELEIIDYDIRELFGDVAKSMAQLAQDKNLEVILDISCIDQTFVKGDPSRLRQVLINIISNAIKFTHHGEIIIRAETSELDKPHLSLSCSIIDSGIGIPLESQDKLFSSFTQVDSSTTRKYGGTGLGLAISKKLCNLMGGDINLISTAGEGSSFEFHIHLNKSDKSKLVLPKTDISQLNILVVDHNKSTRRALKSQLEHWGAKVKVAIDADMALSVCQDAFKESEQPGLDIAFIDLALQNVNGEELAQKLQIDSRFKKIKLIMMTTFAELGDARKYADLGFSAYFPKPATTTDLFKALSVLSEDGEVLKNAEPLITSHYLKDIGSIIDPDIENISWPEASLVLLVEDNHVNQLVAKGILENLGLSVEIASDGIEAIKTLKNNEEKNYSCILMDCLMPNMDGYQATGEIRNGMAGDQYKNIPIIAMTANAMLGDKEKCLDAGMDDYLTKPIVNKDLVETLRKHLNN